VFARFLRAAPFALFFALISACLKVVGEPMLAAMGPDAPGTMLHDGLAAGVENYLLIAVFGLIFGLLYGSVLESRVGGIR
jgi:hypothetical protein